MKKLATYLLFISLLLVVGVNEGWGQTILNIDDVCSVISNSAELKTYSYNNENITFSWSAGLRGDNDANVVKKNSNDFLRMGREADKHLKIQFKKGTIQAGDHIVINVARCTSDGNCDLGIFTIKQTNSTYSIIDPTSALLSYNSTTDDTKSYNICYILTENDINTVDDNTQNIILTGFWYNSTAIHSIKIGRNHIDPSITVSAPTSNAITLNAGETYTFKAEAAGEGNQVVVWRKYSSANEEHAYKGETICYGNTYTYTAPNTPGTYYIGADATQQCLLNANYESSAPKIITINVNQIYKNLDLSFTYNDETKTRQYRVYVPSSVLSSPTQSVPVVFSLHGTGNSNDPSVWGVQNYNNLADQNKFIVIYPQGRNLQFIGGGGAYTSGWEATGVDNEDTEFFRQIISDLSSGTSRELYMNNGSMRFTIDTKKIYISGFSNGGMMAYACANAMPDVFAAFSSISGLQLNEMHMQHHGSRPVPFIHIHGTKDDYVRYRHMPTITDNMVFRNGCKITPTTTTTDNGASYWASNDTPNQATRCTKNEYTDGTYPYIYYEIGTGITSSDTGMGHSSGCYIGGTDSKQIFWEFMSQYSLPDNTSSTTEFSAKINTSTTEGNTLARNHGWTTKSGFILAQYGESGGYTTTNENVYHSIQLNAGTHYINFNVSGTSTNKVTVRLTRLAPLSSFSTFTKEAATSADAVEVEKAYIIGENTNICVKFTNDIASEYLLTIYRSSQWDDTNISDVTISTEGIETSASDETDINTDFTGYFNYNSRLSAQWNFDLCNSIRFNTSKVNSSYWTASYSNTDTGNSSAKEGFIIYTYIKDLGNSSASATDANNYSQLTYDGKIVIPVSAGLKFMTSAGTVKMYVDLTNGSVTGTHLVVENGVKMIIPYVENSYRNDKNVADGPYYETQVNCNKSDYENCMHHIKRDILYVALQTGNFFDHINNKCIDLTNQELFKEGGEEFVNGKNFIKANYCGKNGTPCVVQFKNETIIDRIGINRNLTYSFYTQYINDLGYSKPIPRMQVIGNPSGQKVANIGSTSTTYENAIACTFGGWKNTDDSYSYKGYNGSDVTDNWGELDESASANSIAVDGFSVLSHNNVLPTSESLMPSKTTGNKYHEACNGIVNTINDGENNNVVQIDYKENFTPWTIPCRGAYIKFEPTIPGVLNVNVFQTGYDYSKVDLTDKNYFINKYYILDEFGIPVSDGVYCKTESGVDIDNSYAGFRVKSDSYVKYSFNVYPGKTYYMLSPTAGIGFAGFYFEPYVYRTSTTDELARQDIEMKSLTLEDGVDYKYESDLDESVSKITSPGTNGNVTYEIHSSNKAVSVELNRSFAANTWNSICLPFSMNALSMEAVFGKGTKVVLLRDIQTNNSSSFTTANFIRHENQDIIAGYPYLIYPTQNVTSIKTNAYIPEPTPDITPDIVSISSEGPKTTTGSGNYGGISDYEFKGTFSNITANIGSYYMNSKGSLSRTTKGIALKPYRAYLSSINNTLLAKAIGAICLGDMEDEEDAGEATGIKSIELADVLSETTSSISDSNIYNLQGQKVGKNLTDLKKLSKGVYIVNGRKYIVK